MKARQIDVIRKHDWFEIFGNKTINYRLFILAKGVIKEWNLMALSYLQ